MLRRASRSATPVNAALLQRPADLRVIAPGAYADLLLATATHWSTSAFSPARATASTSSPGAVTASSTGWLDPWHRVQLATRHCGGAAVDADQRSTMSASAAVVFTFSAPRRAFDLLS